jgi:excisionase family DNA binding protein
MSESEWPTVEEAAQQLGASTRTIARWIAERRIATQRRPVRGRKPVVVVDPQDVERIKSEQQTPVVLTEAAAPSQKSDNALAVRAAPGGELAQLVSCFEALRAPAPLKPWLTTNEASAFSGLTRGWLLGEAESGVGSIAIRDMGKHARGGRWRFLRADLETGE